MLTDSTGHSVPDPSQTGHYEYVVDDAIEDLDPRVVSVLLDIGIEVERAEGLHAPLNSMHEAYAVILEELDEFWEEVRKKSGERNHVNARTELIQTAAMCVRTILNVIGEVHEPV